MVNPLSYFSFKPVLHDGVTKAVVCVILSENMTLQIEPTAVQVSGNDGAFVCGTN